MDKLGQFCIERSLKIQMLKWFGYVVRIGQDRKIREIMKTIQEGRGTIGRSRTSIFNIFFHVLLLIKFIMVLP